MAERWNRTMKERMFKYFTAVSWLRVVQLVRDSERETEIVVFSKYGWMLPLKTKTGVEVASALKEIFKERKPGLIG